MLKKDEKVGDYTLIEKVGSGGFGEVWKAEKRTSLSVSTFAIKFFRAKDDEDIDLETVVKEVTVWQRLSGLPHIISVIEGNQFEDYVYIVSEFADGGSLDKWLRSHGGKANSYGEAVSIISQILQGLEGMHSEGFVHRDLKPANVLVKRNILYLADFGISRQMKTHSKTTGTAGTYDYMPPEAFDGKPLVSVHTDIWAAGVLLQKLLTGSMPFPQNDIPSLMGAIIMREPAPLPEDVPAGLKEIVKKALQKKLEDRFQSAREMREALQDPQKFLESQTSAPAETIIDKDPETETEVIEPTQDWRSIEAEKTRQQQLAETNRLIEAEGISNHLAARSRQAEIDKVPLNLKSSTPNQSSPDILKWIAAGVSTFVLLVLVVVGLVFLSKFINPGVGNTSTTPNNLVTLKNSIGMEFVRISAGSFMIGSDTGYPGDKPAHKVMISTEFYLGRYEVTQAQWTAVMGNNPSYFKGDNLPVEQVSWEDAQEFINKLNAKGDGTYRLPTEAEWEYAARAGATEDYAGDLDTAAWYDKNSGNRTHEVGTKQANAWGLYDMQGNVWEWCQDWDGKYSSESVIDPTGASTGSERINRGGGWNESTGRLGGTRLSARNSSLPSARNSITGFRLLRTK